MNVYKFYFLITKSIIIINKHFVVDGIELENKNKAFHENYVVQVNKFFSMATC